LASWAVVFVFLAALGCQRADSRDDAETREAGSGAGTVAATGGAARAAEKPGAERVATPVNPARQRAPDFALASLDGKTVRLSDLQGQVVLLDFWATWCGPCRMSIPHLIELQKQYADRRFTVVGISLDRTGTDGVAAFAAGVGISYPVVMGTPAVAMAYGGVSSIPMAFLVDREGYVVRVFRGFHPKEALEKEIVPLLEG
jgi:thiol-disulfide isomerase/thioredoxin